MEDWEAEAKKVHEEFEEEGFPIVIRVKGSPGVFNPDTLQYDGATADSDYDTFGLKKAYNMHMIDNTIVQQNDTRLLFPALSLPEIGTKAKILVSGEEVNVIKIKKIDPGDVAILYEAQIRE